MQRGIFSVGHGFGGGDTIQMLGRGACVTARERLGEGFARGTESTYTTKRNTRTVLAVLRVDKHLIYVIGHESVFAGVSSIWLGVEDTMNLRVRWSGNKDPSQKRLSGRTVSNE